MIENPVDPAAAAEGVTTCAFGPLQISYDTTVLEPRDWTAQQSSWAAELLADLPAGRVLELCSGAGQIGLLTLHLSDRCGVLVDADDSACAWARHNARAAGLTTRVEVRHADVSEALGPGEYFPFILIDPPWVPTAEVTTFPQDPVVAIDGGADGMDVAHRCLAVAAAHLTGPGRALLQLGTPAQADSLRSWLERPETPPLTVSQVRAHDERGVLVLLDRS